MEFNKYRYTSYADTITGSDGSLTTDYKKWHQWSTEPWWHFENAVDINKTLEMVDKFTGEKLMHSNMITFEKNNACLLGGHKNGVSHGESGNSHRERQNGTKYWYQMEGGMDLNKFKADLTALRPGGTTQVSSGLMVAANALTEKNEALKGKKLNPQKILIMLTDGNDAFWHEGGELPLTKNLLNAGLCDRIRNRLKHPDILVNPEEKDTSPEPKIFYVLFDAPAGDKPSAALTEAWKKCVGEENYVEANGYQELLKALQKAIKPIQSETKSTQMEEVGTFIGK